MAITAFNSFTDGLDPNRRSREHFVTNLNLDDDRRWVPYADGVWLQPCHFNVTSGGFSVVLKGLPGAALGTHYHVRHGARLYHARSLAVPGARLGRKAWNLYL